MLLLVTQKCARLGVNGVNGHHVRLLVAMVVQHLEHVLVNLVLTVRVRMLKKWAVKQQINALVHSNGQTGPIVR